MSGLPRSTAELLNDFGFATVHVGDLGIPKHPIRRSSTMQEHTD